MLHGDSHVQQGFPFAEKFSDLFRGNLQNRAQSGQVINDYTRSQIVHDITESESMVVIMLGGNNFDPYLHDENIHNKMVQEVIFHFQDILDFAENTSSEVVICALIPRPRYPFLEKYFKKTSLLLSQLCTKYRCATFIDIQSFFYNSNGQILSHFFKNDKIHLNRFTSKNLAIHIFKEISNK